MCEALWDLMESGGWDVLADDPSYPPTRLSGNPPALEQSQIDYIIVSDVAGGLQGEEIEQTVGLVHTELIDLAGGGLALRTRASDHLPVIVRLEVILDDD